MHILPWVAMLSLLVEIDSARRDILVAQSSQCYAKVLFWPFSLFSLFGCPQTLMALSSEAVSRIALHNESQEAETFMIYANFELHPLINQE